MVRGVGAYLPERVLTNDELSKMVDTSDEWIVQRTGIKERHIAAAGETTSMLGEKAARAALAHAGLTPADIDLVIVATSTPDYTFPSTATQIQAMLGMTQGVAFDLQAVCSGFISHLRCLAVECSHWISIAICRHTHQTEHGNRLKRHTETGRQTDRQQRTSLTCHQLNNLNGFTGFDKRSAVLTRST